jgi:hypothetical protein
MAGMKFKAFPLMGTWVFAGSFVSVLLWQSIFREVWSGILTVLLLLGLLCYAAASLIVALSMMSKIGWQRLSIVAVALVSFIPVVWLGNLIRIQLFLAYLPDYQIMTEQVLQRSTSDRFNSSLAFRGPSWALLVRDRAMVTRYKDGDIIVLYSTWDSSALGHSGFMYCSSDDPEVMKAKHNTFGYKKLAPYWYEWGA